MLSPGQRLLRVLQQELQDLGCTTEHTGFLYPRPARRKRWLLLSVFLCTCLVGVMLFRRLGHVGLGKVQLHHRTVNVCMSLDCR